VGFLREVSCEFVDKIFHPAFAELTLTEVIFIPEVFARAVVELHGAEGERWLRRLHATVAECAARWSLRVGPPLTPLYQNYIATATRADGASVILKLGPPVRELLTEIEALRIFDGGGCVRLLEADAGLGALLLERLEPGTQLAALCERDDALATAAASSVMRRLWRPAPLGHTLPTVADWGRGFQRLRARFGPGAGPFPSKLVDEAETLFAELTRSMSEPVLLHGDLHHFNILAAAREPWLAVDPKGVVGESAYEVGALLRNPWPQLLTWPQLRRVQARRVEQLAEELGFDKQRLRGWAFAQAVLSAWWSFEDTGKDWEHGVAVAESLAAIAI